MSQYIYIEKIKEDTAVVTALEGEEQFCIPKYILPAYSREGDVLKLELSFDPYKTLEMKSIL
ncbi:MAG: hypothetical protein GX974_05175 [Clostridiales bacterium]|nr:hypothetical protein [Clostridiales bacterium]